MKYITKISLLLSFFIAGCSAALIPHTNNPDKLLEYGQTAIATNRIPVARDLFHKAISLCEHEECTARAKMGIAMTNMNYGYSKEEKKYVCRSVCDNKTAERYLKDYIAYFNAIHDNIALTYGYTTLGQFYYIQDQKTLMCKQFHKAKDSFHKINLDTNPASKMKSTKSPKSSLKDFRKFFKTMDKIYNCK